MTPEVILITYQIQVSPEASASEKAQLVALEQSVELPQNVLTEEQTKHIVPEIRAIHPLSETLWEVQLAHPRQNFDTSATQFLNLLFGNCSLFEGVKIVSVDWGSIRDILPGPQFGLTGIRRQFLIETRPLSCTALKPMGSSSAQFAQFTHDFALGGIDIIKDDHGLANQSTSPFKERVRACVRAISEAADSTGHRARYFPHISAGPVETIRRYEEAFHLGADGVLVCPHLVGLETMVELRNHELPLPIMAHPSFSGVYVSNPHHGFSPSFLYGELWKACGADFSIYPNAGGRFSFSLEECQELNHSCRESSVYPGIFPTPGGGINRERILYWKENYGNDTVFLIGGSLYAHPKGIVEASKALTSQLAL